MIAGLFWGFFFVAGPIFGLCILIDGWARRNPDQMRRGGKWLIAPLVLIIGFGFNAFFAVVFIELSDRGIIPKSIIVVLVCLAGLFLGNKFLGRFLMRWVDRLGLNGPLW